VDDPLNSGLPRLCPPSGTVAGVYARTDSTRGVWKAPAGIEGALLGVRGLERNLTDAENGTLNALGVNCLRTFATSGPVAWGARTLRGSDDLGDECKYVPVRRLALYLEASLTRGLEWVVLESNDEPLWVQIRLNVGAFMNDLFRRGAFQGNTPRDAYLVKCDGETTTQGDKNNGIVNILAGFAPLQPAEFVILKIQLRSRRSIVPLWCRSRPKSSRSRPVPQAVERVTRQATNCAGIDSFVRIRAIRGKNRPAKKRPHRSRSQARPVWSGSPRAALARAPPALLCCAAWSGIPAG